MNTITTFFIAFCSSCILIGALYIICPDGVMSKPVKYVFSLVFLVILIAATSITIKNTDIDFSNKFEKIPENSSASVTAAEYVYSYALKSAGINFSKITVCTDKTDNGSIIINKVIIYSDCDKSVIVEALGVVAQNYEVEVINE